MTVGGREPIVLAAEGDAAVAGFGVATGWAHETPRLRGVTDRAMQWLADTPGVTAKWHVDPLVTYFWVSGSPRAVQIGLSDVLRQARRTPVPAPLTQTTALSDPDAELLMRRWGLRGFGLQGWRRLGFVTAQPKDLADVLARIGLGTVQPFVVNAEVDFQTVPDIDAVLPPEPVFPPLIKVPALLDASGGFAMSWHVPRRDPVAEGLMRLAVAQAADSMAGGRHGPHFAPEPRWLIRNLASQGSHTAMVLPRGLSDEATAFLADRLRRWLLFGPDQADLDLALGGSYDARPQSSWDIVRGAVEETLIGLREEPLAEPTVQGALEALSTLLDSLLVIAPAMSTAVRLAELPEVPAPEPVAGDSFRYIPLIRKGERRRVVVTAGAEGVGVRNATSLTAIRRPDVVAVEQWPGGQQQVTALDGTQVTLDPSEFRGGDRLAGHVRDLARDELVIHRESTEPSPTLARAYRQAGGWALTGLVLMTPALLLAALLLLGAIAESEPGGNRVGFATVGLLFAVLGGMAALRTARLLRVGRSVRLGAWGQPRSGSGG